MDGQQQARLDREGTVRGRGQDQAVSMRKDASANDDGDDDDDDKHVLTRGH